MKDRHILKVISTYESLNVEELNKNNLGVEFQDFTEPNLSENERVQIIEFYKRELKKLKGKKSMHAPFLDLKPASPDFLIREISMKKYQDALDIANTLELDYIVFHSQINPDLNQEFIRQLNARQNAEAWNILMNKFKTFKGQVVIENVFEKDPYILKELLDFINLKNVKVNLDIGHAKLSEVNLKEWVNVLNKYLAYSHIHTNDGRHDNHNPITKEEIDNYFEILDVNQLNPMIVLEYKIVDVETEMKKFI